MNEIFDLLDGDVLFQQSTASTVEEALAANRNMQNTLKDLLNQVETQLDLNEQNTKNLKSAFQNISHPTRSHSLFKSKAPFFRDRQGNLPANNQDLNQLIAQGIPSKRRVVFEDETWSFEEKELLENTVEAEYRFQRSLLGLFTDQIDKQDVLLNVDSLNWNRIAENFTRSPIECKQKYLLKAEPLKLTQAQITKLKSVQEPVNWIELAHKLNTEPLLLFEYYTANIKPRHLVGKWTKEEDKMLLRAAERHRLAANVWLSAATEIPGRTPQQCSHRFSKIPKKGEKTGFWTIEEDIRLEKAVLLTSGKWAKVAKIVETRNAAQCRDRWENFLKPDLNKSKFTSQEHKKLLDLVAEHGRQWSKIAEKLANGRSHRQVFREYKKLKLS